MDKKSKKSKSDEQFDKWWGRIWRTFSTIWLLAALPSPLVHPMFYAWVLVGFLTLCMGLDLLEAKLETSWLQKVQKKLSEK